VLHFLLWRFSCDVRLGKLTVSYMLHDPIQHGDTGICLSPKLDGHIDDTDTPVVRGSLAVPLKEQE